MRERKRPRGSRQARVGIRIKYRFDRLGESSFRTRVDKKTAFPKALGCAGIFRADEGLSEYDSIDCGIRTDFRDRGDDNRVRLCNTPGMFSWRQKTRIQFKSRMIVRESRDDALEESCVLEPDLTSGADQKPPFRRKMGSDHGREIVLDDMRALRGNGICFLPQILLEAGRE